MVKINRLFKNTENYSGSIKNIEKLFSKVHAMEIKIEKNRLLFQ